MKRGLLKIRKTCTTKLKKAECGWYFRNKGHNKNFHEKISERTTKEAIWFTLRYYPEEPIKISNFILTQQNDYHEEAVRCSPFISHHLSSLSQFQIHSF